jgi:hypothetical protein
MRAGSPWYRQVAVVAVALAAAAAWVLIDRPHEGRVVLTLTRDHGVHTTDVFAIIPLLWAWWMLARRN